jgi:tetratricopeptide (TPR) repeat protein
MRGIAAMLVFTVFCSSALAADEAVERGKKMSRAAVDLARSGSYIEAIDLFEKAYRLTGDSMILYNIGQVAARMGDLPKARETLERFLKEEKEPEALERGRKALADVMARWPGWLRVTSPTDGALVEIDGKPAGKTPLEKPIELSPGKHVLKVISPGKHPFERQLEVAASEAIEIAAALEDEPALPSPAPVPARVVATPVVDKAVAANTVAARLEREPPVAVNDLSGRAPAVEKKGLATWQWALIGTGAAVVVAGGIVAGVLLANTGSGVRSYDGELVVTKPVEVGR